VSAEDEVRRDVLPGVVVDFGLELAVGYCAAPLRVAHQDAILAPILVEIGKKVRFG
jgi:hypothetical protein